MKVFLMGLSFTEFLGKTKPMNFCISFHSTVHMNNSGSQQSTFYEYSFYLLIKKKTNTSITNLHPSYKTSIHLAL